jgi:hypothetical protein
MRATMDIALRQAAWIFFAARDFVIKARATSFRR